MLPRLADPICEGNAVEDANGNADAQNDAVNDDDEKKVEENNGGNDVKAVTELTILTHQALVRELALMLDHMLRYECI